MRYETGIELGDLFAHCVRLAVPAARAHGVVPMLDYRGPAVRVHDADGALLRKLELLAAKAACTMGAGFTVLRAVITPGDRRRFRLNVEAEAEPAGEKRDVGDTIEIEGAPHDTAERVNAHGAPAWLIGEDLGVYAALQASLQRLGWRPRVFVGVEQACASLGSPLPNAAPRLVIAHETVRIRLKGLDGLWCSLPRLARLVVASEVGSASLGVRIDAPNAEVRPWPLSPSDLIDVTQHLTREACGDAPLRPKAVVVDDDLVGRVVAAGMLQFLGFDVETASDGTAAVVRCLARPPDLVLTDVQMPGRDGIETIREVRALLRRAALPQPKTVAATANTLLMTRRDDRGAGVDGWLAKPLDIAILDAELARLNVSHG